MGTLWDRAGQTTLLQVLQNALARGPDGLCFDCAGHKASYADIDRQSNGLAHGLAALGVGRGDMVSLMLDNSLDTILLLYAVLKLGAVAAPINTSFRGEFLRHQIADTDPRLIVIEDRYLDRLLSLIGSLPATPPIAVRGAVPPDVARPDVLAFDTLQTADISALDVEVQPDDLALLIYTSGTTGPSKGCMISHNYMCNMGRHVVDAFELTERDVFWTPLPLFHANAINNVLVAMPLSGASLALAERFSLSGFWADVERTGATVVSLIGSLAALIANAPDEPAAKRCRGQVRMAKAAPFPSAIRDVWRERFGVLKGGAPGFGMTEMSMITTSRMSEPAPEGTSGRRFEDFDVRIVDEQGYECPPGTAGEIIARPLRPNIMFQGYWRRPEETLRVMRDLWFHTGDIGTFDADGWFTFVDRKKDYLRRGGENISSFEVEAALREHPDIADVAVHSVPSDLTEDEVKVTATLKPGASLSERELCLWCIDRVPHFAVPRYIEFRADLPRNPVGRVLKFELRAAGVTADTWDRAASNITISRFT